VEPSMTTTTYEVKGMTCGHCVQAVTGAVSALPDVSDVAVDLGTGRVVVTSAVPVAEGQIRAAVDEAGYELVGDLT
jgi:copper chaperone CopZ